MIKRYENSGGVGAMKVIRYIYTDKILYVYHITWGLVYRVIFSVYEMMAR